MPWERSSPELIATFAVVAPGGPGVERRQMFGYPCCFANGNMFMGLHEQRFILRLPPGQHAELLAAGGSQFEPVAGRPMRGYAALPAAVVADRDALKAWVDRAFTHALSLPPKEKKAPRRKQAE